MIRAVILTGLLATLALPVAARAEHGMPATLLGPLVADSTGRLLVWSTNGVSSEVARLYHAPGLRLRAMVPVPGARAPRVELVPLRVAEAFDDGEHGKPTVFPSGEGYGRALLALAPQRAVVAGREYTLEVQARAGGVWVATWMVFEAEPAPAPPAPRFAGAPQVTVKDGVPELRADLRGVRLIGLNDHALLVTVEARPTRAGVRPPRTLRTVLRFVFPRDPEIEQLRLKDPASFPVAVAERRQTVCELVTDHAARRPAPVPVRLHLSVQSADGVRAVALPAPTVIPWPGTSSVRVCLTVHR